MPAEGFDRARLEAKQHRVAAQVVLEDEHPTDPSTVTGFDVAYGEERCYGALARVSLPDLALKAVATASAPIELPYIPGLLAFRELPALDAAWDAAKADGWTPQLLLVDGGGSIHPRRAGSACHAGVRYDVTAVGITKSLLLGEVDGPLKSYGDTAPIRDGDELLGYAYRSSRRATNPIYVSPGHRVMPGAALALAQRCCSGDRKLPEPVHQAHIAAGQARDAAKTGP